MTRFQALTLIAAVTGAAVLPLRAVAQTASPPALTAPSAPSAPSVPSAPSAASIGAGTVLPKEGHEATQKKSEAAEKEKSGGGTGEVHTGSGLKNLDAFLDAHPSIEADLRGKPQLANDKDYIKSHPDFETFLKTHPYVHQSLKDNPAGIINREHKYEEKHG